MYTTFSVTFSQPVTLTYKKRVLPLTRFDEDRRRCISGRILLSMDIDLSAWSLEIFFKYVWVLLYANCKQSVVGDSFVAS